MLTSETKRRIDACRDVLVGKLPLPTDQVELITLALIYKFMDDLDEQSVQMGGRRSFFTRELEQYRWRNLLPQTISAEQRVALFSGGLEAMSDATRAAHLPLLFRDIFRNAFLKFRDGRILTLFLTEINGFTYSHSEELGNAFEYLLQCMGIQGENGQFRTPRHIIDFIVACLDPKPCDKILDPACGTGGFLVSAYKHILAKHTSAGASMAGDLLTHAQRQSVYTNLSGYDITDLMVKLSKVNLFLHGFPSPAIHDYDTLSNDSRWNEKADLILANPPFMTPKGGVTPHTKFRIHAKKAEVLFTDYIAEHLTSDGRAGIIVPNGIVATSQVAYVKLRKFIVEDSLVAVISLPAGVFRPYSGVKTSILLLDKRLARQRNAVLFVKVTADGFDLGDKRNRIESTDLPDALRIVEEWLHEEVAAGFKTYLKTRVVERTLLLRQTVCSLQAEALLGEDIGTSPDELVELSEVATFQGGGTPSKGNPRFWQGDIPWVSPKDMKSLVLVDTEDHLTVEAVESGAAKLLPSETVLCVVRSGILKHTLPVAITARPMCINQDLIAISADKSRLDPKFLLFSLRGRSAEILRDGIKTGVTVQSFHNGFFKTFKIPLPQIEEQQRIVAEIEGYQKVIDGARQVSDGYKPTFEVNPNWDVVRLDDVCDVRDGTHDSPKFVLTDGYPLITSKNLRDGFVSFEDVDYICREDLIAINKRSRVDDGDILMPMIGTIGSPVIAVVNREFAVKNVALIKFHNSTHVINKFVKAILSLPAFHNRLIRQSSGVAQQYISLGSLRSFEIPLPSIEEQQRIIAELDSEVAQIESVRALIPAFESKIQRVLDRVWGNGTAE